MGVRVSVESAQCGLFGIDAVDREGQLPAAGQIAAAGDHQWVGLVGGVFGLCSQWQEQCGQPVAGQRWVIAISGNALRNVAEIGLSDDLGSADIWIKQ